ncbi:hypothetical protein [Psychromonas sp. SA13A]|uniref:hypothetical protein n=1 Tax=Psychromonas sp. SA13A TaxID=2686346 RepID=UPI00140E2DC6|nr:hypothetical protein [Psychromonas sp. SA13A]
MSKNRNDIQAVVFVACETMLREGIKANNITGRKISAQDEVAWSHTTVTPFVRKWHEHRAEKEREAIKLTQMSQTFVKALHKEVEERVVALREIDTEQMQMLQNELQDMIETNGNVEHELTETKESLAKKTEVASQATALAEQCKKDKSKSDNEHKAAIDALQSRYNEDVKELKQTIDSDQSKYISERTELKNENRDAIQKLTKQNDELHTDLKNKTAECAEAKVKSESFEKIASELEVEKNKTDKLKEEMIRQKASIDIKQQALTSAEQTTLDCKSQRDKAQVARETVALELKELQHVYQEVLIKIATTSNILDSDKIPNK